MMLLLVVVSTGLTTFAMSEAAKRHQYVWVGVFFVLLVGLAWAYVEEIRLQDIERGRTYD